ncbi:MAG TPA: cytochrome b N-terminal domain-containing protein [Stellaceae bacterium]|nr:cytochrome b N-terminal domain-containing protein [Stellaceae bacterium]
MAILPERRNLRPNQRSGGPLLQNPFVRWVDHRLPVFSTFDRFVTHYPAPRNLSYWWNFGSLATFMVLAMLGSGIFLAMNYQPDPDTAFASLQRMARDVDYGWLIRSIHMIGASMFFIVVYLHVGRSLYYGSYKRPRELLWMLGLVLFVLMMTIAFTGDVLPWDQRSYSAATVITNLFSVIPFAGNHITNWIRGGYAVGAPTLNRVFILHIVLPFVLVGFVWLHLQALHRHGSNNPTGIEPAPEAEVFFHPYYTIKDLFGLGCFLIVYAAIVFFVPGLFETPDDGIPADPLSTPTNIVPDWYFLPFYAMLRALPNTGLGAAALFGSVLVLFFLPWLDTSPVRSGRYRPLFRWFFMGLVFDIALLGWAGAQPPDGVYIWISRAATFWYFVHFLVVLPVLGKLERPYPEPGR